MRLRLRVHDGACTAVHAYAHAGGDDAARAMCKPRVPPMRSSVAAATAPHRLLHVKAEESPEDDIVATSDPYLQRCTVERCTVYVHI